MKVKGISLFERHVEKIVLVIFVFVFLAVFSAQFLREPNEVQIDTARVAPSKIADTIEKAAEVVKAKLEQKTLALELPEPPNADAFLESLRASSVSRTPLRFVGNFVSDGSIPDPVVVDGGDPVAPVDVPYHVPVVPAATDTLAVVYGGAIDPLVRAAHPELAEYLPAEQPHDAFWISVQGSFDVESFRTSLLAMPGEGEAPLPRAWTDVVEILAVDIVREQLMSDGTWSDQQIVDELPGILSLRDRLDDPKLRPQELLTDLLSIARDHREAIRRQEFYPIISGDQWTWPSQILASEFAEDVIRDRERLVRLRRGLAAEVSRIEKLLNKESRPGSSPGSSPRDSRERGDVSPDGTPATKLPPFGEGAETAAPSAQSGGGRSGGRRNTTKNTQRSQAAREKEIREQLEIRLKDKQEELTQVDAQLEELGFGPAGLPLGGEDETFQELSLALIDDAEDAPSEITLWAHDLTAREGETYRYALSVRVTNPLFGKAEQVPAEQVSQASTATLVSAPTDWSSPIEVPTQTMYFVTSGRDANAVGGLGSKTSADVEVFRFFYGYWRMEALTISPGESLATAIELPDTLVTYTLVMKDGAEMPIVEGSEPMPVTLSFESDTVLLDVAVTGTAKTQNDQRRTNVFLSEGDGRVVVREPRTDEDADDRLRYSESAQHGTAGVVAEPVYTPSREGMTSNDRGPRNTGSRERRDAPPSGNDSNNNSRDRRERQ